MTFVGAAWLSELRLVACDIEYVVDDLEHDTELGRKAAVGDCGRSAHAGGGEPAAHGGGDQRARLELVQVTQLDVGRAAHVEVLAAHHAVHAGSGDELAHRGQHVGRLAGLVAQREPQGLGEEPVARQDRHVLAEGHVTGGLPAAELVVVHRRQVVVDQRVGVDHLDGGSER